MNTDLEQLVSDIADLTGAAPPAVLDEDAPVLAAQSRRTASIAASAADTSADRHGGEALYLVGLIGGKDVGKGSLDYAVRLARVLKLENPPRVFMISAQSSHEFDFPALRDLLSVQKSSEAVRASQELAGRQQARTILAWIDRQQLPGRIARTQRLLT